MPPEDPSPFTANSSSTSATSAAAQPLPQATAVTAPDVISQQDLAKYGVTKPKRVVIRGKITRGKG